MMPGPLTLNASLGEESGTLMALAMPSMSLHKARAIGYRNYTEYLKSRHWRSLKRQYRLERNWSCYCCGVEDGLHLHHLTYERIGEEDLDDLLPLCERCHAAIHEGGNLDPRDPDRLVLIFEYALSRPDMSREKIMSDIRREVRKRRRDLKAREQLKTRRRNRRAAERGSASRPLVQAK